MRQIKFRAWDKEIKEIVDIDKIDFNLGYAFYVDDKEEVQRVPLEDLMQFTGLTDKNGKEIYEGDIVEVKYSDGSGYDNPVEVSFENGSFWAGMGYLNDIKIIEVVGNIFQNPELLK